MELQRRPKRAAALIAKKAWCPDYKPQPPKAKVELVSKSKRKHGLVHLDINQNELEVSSRRPLKRPKLSLVKLPTPEPRSPAKSNCVTPVKNEKSRDEEIVSFFPTPSSSIEDSKENLVKAENEILDDDDLDGDNPEEFSYHQIRDQNLKANQEFLAQIGMQQAKEDFEASIAKKKKFVPSRRGLKPPKRVVEPLPRRQSMRIRRVDPTGVPLPEPELPDENPEEERLPETVSMKERHYDKVKNDEDVNLSSFFSTMSSLPEKENLMHIKSNSTENKSLIKQFSKLKINDTQVAKVVPGRVYSLGWHPSKSKLIAIAGDKYGYVGCWNVSATENDDLATTFQPHVKPVTHVHVPLNNGRKLYTSSYDSTLRCGDFEKGMFDLIYSVPEEDDDLFRNFDFIGDTSSMLVSHFRGLVSLVDTRTSTKSAEMVFNSGQQSLRKVSVHPIATDYFVTSGRNGTIRLWDLRSVKVKSPVAVQTIRAHSKGVTSAYFSPISGNEILTCSTDDTIQIFSDVGGKKYDLATRIKHNNHTGRWLTPFQPSWHPTVEGVFVSGSMARPRQIEVFNVNGDIITNLRGDYLASVCSLNAFHPTRPSTLVGANSSGRLHVFM